MLWAFNKSGSLLKFVYFLPFIAKLSLSVCCWRHLEILGKEAVEVGGIGVAASVDDFLYGQVAVSQQDACFLQFQPLDKLGEILAGTLHQQPGHLSVAVGEMLGQLVQGQVFAVVLQVVQYGNDGRIGAGVFGFCTVGMASQQENETGGHQAVKHLSIV